MLHPLEPRWLLSAITLLDKGVLSITGTPNRDVIAVDFNPQTGQLLISLNALSATIPAADVKSIRVHAGAGNDTVTIADRVRVPADLYGGPGNDYLRGGSQRCRLYGEEGHDTLVGGIRNDVFSGGPGIDTVDYSARTHDLRLSLDGKANDGHTISRGERDNIGNDIERIIGGQGNDVIVGNALRNTLQGGPGNDSLVGGPGDDVLVGGPGADTLLGGDGDDILLGIDLSDLDVLDGGEGFDSATFDSITADSVTWRQDTLLNIEAEIFTLQTVLPVLA